MQRMVGPIIAVVGAVAIGGFLVNKHSTRADAAEKELAWTKIQRDYLEKVGWIRAIPDENQYRTEAPAFFANYFKNVDAHLERFGGNTDFDDYVKEREARGVKDLDKHKEHWEFVKKQFDLMRGGRYAPVFTATDKGMRLDVVSADVEMVNGEPMIRFVMALSGAQRELREEGRGLKKMATSARFAATMEPAADEAGRKPRVSRAEPPWSQRIEGDPGKKIDHPERFIPEFPPQFVLGHYDLPRIPSYANRIQVTFNVGSTSSTGGSAEATYVWKLDAPTDWKLRPGEAFEGATEIEGEEGSP